MYDNIHLIIDYGTHIQEFYNVSLKDIKYGDDYKLIIYNDNGKIIREIPLTGSWEKKIEDNKLTFKKVG